MQNKEVDIDFFVRDLLVTENIFFYTQWQWPEEIVEALKWASKTGWNGKGFPEFIGIIKDFLLVIEDKKDYEKHVRFDEKNLISLDLSNGDVKDFAMNGALHYAKHLAEKTNYKKILAIWVSGNPKRHRITPIFVNERGEYEILEDVENFTNFNEKNIEEYYLHKVLKEETREEKTTEEILKDAKKLHEDLKNYWSIQDKDKPLIVSGILLALKEIEFKWFSMDELSGDAITTDWEKIYNAIEKNLKRANVSPETKKDKLLSQFLVIRDTKAINEIHENLGKTPMKHYAEFLYEHIYKNIKYIQSSEDYLWRFYGEFMKYSGGDGQTLWIILTPKHITELFCELVDLKVDDKVFDPCCWTAGFLIAAMHNMMQQATTKEQENQIKKHQLHGIEMQPYMFTIATTNMILRGDGKSNINQEDFLKQNPYQLQTKGCTVGMINPPYSQGSKKNPNLYEISFIEHLLKSIVVDGKVIAIIPQSSMTGKTKEEKNIKTSILKNHTLEGVITLNKNTFYGVGTNPCIAIFTAYNPHPKDKIVKFINFEDDGFEVQKHIWLVENKEKSKDKRQKLLSVWRDEIEEIETKFCVKTTIEAEDEWLHSFYYFNDEIPTEAEFEETMADYLTFEFDMITHGRGYLFGLPEKDNEN